MSKTKIETSIPGISSKKVPVWIGADFNISDLFDFKPYSKIVIISDNKLLAISEKIKKNIPYSVSTISLEVTEKNKSVESISFLWTELNKLNCDRKSIVINVGGGLLCDTAGFAASTYMRGIKFIQIPTTLLSQVDASVGGKVGINHNGLKNLVGSFEQPEMVVCDTSFLGTLPENEFNSGMAEVIKHGLIRSKKYFEFVKNAENISQAIKTQIVYGSVEIKSNVVAQDPTEQGLRKILNFGHTIGHAIESISQETENPYLHGEAIALGMIVEAKISLLNNKLSEDEFQSIIDVIKKYNLPIKLSRNFAREKIFSKIIADKKNNNGIINWTLLNTIGKSEFDQKVRPEIVVQAVESII